MAFASVGSRGSMNEKSVNQTGVISPSATVSAGNLLGVWVAWQSHYFFGPDGSQNLHHGCIDSVGNIYNTLVSWYTPGGAGTYIGLFMTEVTTAITTSDTITVTFFGTGGQTKAISLWEFSKDPTKRWAYVRDQSNGAGAFPGDPPSVTLSSLPSGKEYLLLHVLGSQGPNTDSFTWDSDYTQITGDGTTGGADSSNITLRGGFRIATLTTDTVDVTSDTADRNCDNAIMAICEVEGEGFPRASVVDNFNRADEDPLDNGTWDTTKTPGFGTAKLKVATNVVAMSSGTGEGSQQWIDEATGHEAACAEVFATLSTRGAMNLYWLGTGDGGLATLDALCVGSNPESATNVGSRMYQGDAGNQGNIASGVVISSWFDMQSGDKVGGQWISPVLHLWLDDGSGWRWVSADYRTSAPTIRDQGFFAMSTQGDTATRIDDFGFGFGCLRAQQQIIRRIFA